ncbi:major facilitator superfamily domain-containing protein [Xylaria bambusicola]|uniref:major facilitator superfamily domain-containing protein n=1 Tax=Xylaria bambusicola TaxID=326684 RepID=UPI0020082C34|nr:major facilitator superfamily domain-containing protein [Xylaria bambusicola]KAI0508846.1 major facilitator superfamily domain-containing protein [Xylaria bambusicola]
MSGPSPDATSEQNGRGHHNNAEKVKARTSDVKSTEGAADEEPPTEMPVPSGKKYSVFTTFEKRAIVLGAAAGAFFSPLSAQIYFPALETLSRDLHISITEVNLTVTTYMIVQAIAPMFVGSLADSAGRRPAYILCFIIYIAACIGCALAPNYAALLVLRALQAAGSSATVSLCQAVVSDVVTSAERGSYVGFTSVPIIFAPSVGPVIGGVISQYLGWRWIFWFLTILAGFVLVLFLLFMPETCRLIVDDGSVRPHTFYRTFWQLIKDANRKKKAIPGTSATEKDSKGQSSRIQRPNLARTLFILFEKEMFLLLMYSSLIYAGFYAVSTAIPAQFASLYGFSGLKIGLIYIPLGVGSIVAVFVMGKLANWNYRRICKKLNIPYDKSRQQNMAGFPIEQARLQISLPFLALFTLVLIGFGWAVQYKAHLAVEIVLLFLQGVTLVAFSNLLSTLIVDINPGAAGAATAANNLTRCLVGAGASAFINPLMTAVGPGWAFTIIGLSYVVFFPALWLVLKNGVKWREDKARKAELKKQQKQQGEHSADHVPNSGQEHEKDGDQSG